MRHTLKNFYFIIFSICLLNAVPASAQDAKKDFFSINKAYAELKNLSMDVEYTLYSDYTTTKPFQVKHAHTRLWEKGLYYRVDDVEVVTTDKVQLIANHEEKKLFLSEAPLKAQRKLADLELDSSLKRYSKVEYRDKGNGRGMYELYLSSGPYEKVSVIFNRQTFLVEKIIMWFDNPLAGEEGLDRHPPRMEISYKNVSLAASGVTAAFTEKKFVHLVKGEYKLQPAYRQYEFVNAMPVKN